MNKYGPKQYTGASIGRLGDYDPHDIRQMSLDIAAILRRLIQMRGNLPARDNQSRENRVVLQQKIIEIQGLLSL